MPATPSAQAAATPDKTDWDAYYSRPYATASFTRPITANKLLSLFRAHAPNKGGGLSMVEYGGANSCFCEQFITELRPATYDVVDNNQLGLDAFRRKQLPAGVQADGHLVDVLADDITSQISARYDLCFSVGLIEHFDPAGTAKAVGAHFAAVKPGGLVVITYPTPTLLYRSIRGLAEMSGQWIFWDERPLLHDEVERALAPHGELLWRGVNYWIMLTQGIVVARKHG